MQGVGRDARTGDSPKREKDLRSSAILHQQRRLKQATQFVHKDSADLLPLDQLRRLGTSKDLQPHSVIQRRLLGGSLSTESSDQELPIPPCIKGTDPPPQGDKRIQPTQSDGETLCAWKEQALLIPCKVCGHDIWAKLCTEHQQNLISRSCAEKLGLGTSEQNGHNLPKELQLDIELGPERLTCEAVIMDEDLTEFFLGLKTLVSLKSCIDLERGVLKTPLQEIPFLNPFDTKSNTEKPVKDQSPQQGTTEQ
ncbi:nuclear receptor-interacting protein 2 [Xenopus laevis]|uniref:Nuclear receptor-interacting protein 2 n=2 Tax=Xenopus laevis TaxID=8355 RepID=A0A1L8GWE0_XENLA|nr:nuclear receptor-interacting protein 2 [Xenopus laevis]OCT88131.1 hypothetical protein XELAEV_18016762mg [Xenopus laevis]